MNENLFHSATLRLTAWYVTILVILSLLFSIIVYTLASHEFERAVGPRRAGEMPLFIESEIVNELRQERVAESNRYLVGNLAVFNIATLTIGGVASYFLARRTLRPIEEALDSQSRFSSDAAHELRTPLTVMQSEIEVALRGKQATKASYAETLQSNLDEVERLRTLTDRLLLLASNSDISLQPTQLEEVAIEAVGRLVTLAQAKQITVENEVGQFTVMANHESLADVLTVLVDNAIKYSPDKSTIRLTSEQKDKFVHVHIIDTGRGMSEQEIAKSFDRFYRADTARSAQHVEGHGLGLSIAKRLVELQNGSISVTSAPDKGSTFTVKIPAAS